MHSRFQDLVPVHLKEEGDPELERPSEEDIEEVLYNSTCLQFVMMSILSPLLLNIVIIIITFGAESYRQNTAPVDFCSVEPLQ